MYSSSAASRSAAIVIVRRSLLRHRSRAPESNPSTSTDRASPRKSDARAGQSVSCGAWQSDAGQAGRTPTDAGHTALHQPRHRAADSAEAAGDGLSGADDVGRVGRQLGGRRCSSSRRSRASIGGGDLDELTLLALGLPQVLRGEVPPGGEAPVSASAAASGGAPVSASPRLTRVLQNKLTEAGFPTAQRVRHLDRGYRQRRRETSRRRRGSTSPARWTCRSFHALGFTDSMLNPKPGKLPTDSVGAGARPSARCLLTGAPIFVSAPGIRQVQTALQQRGHKDVVVDGKWSDALSAALKKFQEAQKLEPTGSLNLRTLRALGFDQPAAAARSAVAGGATVERRRSSKFKFGKFKGQRPICSKSTDTGSTLNL